MRSNFYTSTDICLQNNVRRKNNDFVVIMTDYSKDFVGLLNNKNTQS